MAEQVPAFDELLQRLDGEGVDDGEPSKAVHAAPREPVWSYEKLVGFEAVESGTGLRDRSEQAYQERDTLGALPAGTRLGRAPFKQRAAEEAARQPPGVEKAAPFLPGRRPKAAAPAAAPRFLRKGASEAEATPDCPWRLSTESLVAGPSRPSEALPGLRLPRKKGRGARSRGSSKEKGGASDPPPPKPVRKELPVWPRKPREAPADDGELLALLGGTARAGSRSRGHSQGSPGDDARHSSDGSPVRRPAADSEANGIVPPGGSDAQLGGAQGAELREGAPEDEGGAGDLADDAALLAAEAELRAAEAEAARLAVLEELLSSADLHEEGTFQIAGTWDDFQQNDMIAVGARFVYFAPGYSSFQILYKGDWARTLYPSTADGNPFDGHTVMGPDERGHGKNWTIGRHAGDRAPPGTFYKVELAFDDPDAPMIVRWETVGPEAAARRAKEAVLQEARGVGSEGHPPAASGAAAALPAPALRPLTGAWDGVPMNLGQAYDVDVAFSISVDLRTPPAHKDQGGRVLAKRAGRSGWELVAPRRETGEVSFYSSTGGHLNIGLTRVDDGEWHHVAVTFDQQGQMRSYVDGCLDGEVAHIVKPHPDAALWVGTRTEKSGLFIGDLRDLQVFDCALSGEEVAILFEAAARSRD